MNFRGAKVNAVGSVSNSALYKAWLMLQQMKIRKQQYFSAPGLYMYSTPAGDVINIYGAPKYPEIYTERKEERKLSISETTAEEGTYYATFYSLEFASEWEPGAPEPTWLPEEKLINPPVSTKIYYEIVSPPIEGVIVSIDHDLIARIGIGSGTVVSTLPTLLLYTTYKFSGLDVSTRLQLDWWFVAANGEDPDDPVHIGMWKLRYSRYTRYIYDTLVVSRNKERKILIIP